MTTRRPYRWAFASIALAIGLCLCVARPATAQPTAHASVVVPAVQGAGVVMLDLSVRASGTGNLGGVVRLRRPGGSAIEVGRFSVFGAGEQSYQFNVAGALRQLGLSGGRAEVEVALIDRSDASAPGRGELTIDRAEIVTR